MTDFDAYTQYSHPGPPTPSEAAAMSGPYDEFAQFAPYFPTGQDQQLSQDERYMQGLPPYQPISSGFIPQEFGPSDEIGAPAASIKGNTRARQRNSVAGEQVKHRRTRSGCYTCRNRRVKCDENRPTCERCKKGNRDCVYPEPSTSSKARRRDSKSSKVAPHDSGSSPSGDEGEDATGEGAEILATIRDNEEVEESLSRSQTFESQIMEGTITPSLQHRNSSTPPTESSTSGSVPSVGAHSASSRRRSRQLPPKGPTILPTKPWADLPRDVLFYLDFFRMRINNYYYSFKYDFDDYMHTTFLEIAIGFEPLLYAVVGFAAYHYSVARGEGKIQDFLQYYNRSVKSLRLYLTKNPNPDVATLFTVLQLATIEEYLGDWVSVLSHQKAACHLFTRLYTLKTVMADETSRRLMSWYLRFDLVAGMLSGNGTFLPRDWYVLNNQYYTQAALERPTDLEALYKERVTVNGLICADAAGLWARKSRGQISEDEFNAQADELMARLTGYETRFPHLIVDPSKFIVDFSEATPRTEDDIVDPYQQNFLWGDPIWSSNLMMLDWWAIELMFKHQLSAMRRQPPPENINNIAFKMMQMFESIQRYPNKPAGILVAAQAAIGVAGLFMPKDERHSTFVRRKLATVEAMGFTYPNTFRQKMGHHWGVDLSHWWLPNDEDFPPMLRAVRSLIQDRSELPQRDQLSEDIRDMRGIFTGLSLDENAPAESPSSVTGHPDDKGKHRLSAMQEFLINSDGRGEAWADRVPSRDFRRSVDMEQDAAYVARRPSLPHGSPGSYQREPTGDARYHDIG